MMDFLSSFSVGTEEDLVIEMQVMSLIADNLSIYFVCGSLDGIVVSAPDVDFEENFGEAVSTGDLNTITVTVSNLNSDVVSLVSLNIDVVAESSDDLGSGDD